MSKYDELLEDEKEDEELIRFYRSQEVICCQGHITCDSCSRAKQNCPIKQHLGK